MKDVIKRLHEQFYYNDLSEMGEAVVSVGSLEAFILEELEKQKKEIKKDLLKIADSGEYEDMRREVENYFNNLNK